MHEEILSCFAAGLTYICNVANMRVKECDHLLVLVNGPLFWQDLTLTAYIFLIKPVRARPFLNFLLF